MGAPYAQELGRRTVNRASGRARLAAARSLIRRGRHAEALTRLEALFDDPLVGIPAVDSAMRPVWHVHGFSAALSYWAGRLAHRLPQASARSLQRRARVGTRGKALPVKLAVVSHNWSFLREELEALGCNPRFTLRTVTPGPYVARPGAQRTRGPGFSLTQAHRDDVAVLRWADLVFCDWCTRPAIWLAACLPRRTALCVRLHSFEAHSPFPLLVDWSRVSETMFVAEHIRDYVDASMGLSRRVPTSIVPCVQNVDALAHAKRPEARWTLGMIGYNTKNKHPIMALEILSRLRQLDARWRLRLVGHPFDDAPTADDRAYGTAFSNAVAALGLKPSVTITPFTTDVGRWLRNVGFILSTSERESTHLAVAEGMSSGAIPIVRRWPVFRSLAAAERRYPGAVHFDDADEAAAAIARLTIGADADVALQRRSLECIDQARRRFDRAVGIPRLEAVLLRAAGVSG